MEKNKKRIKASKRGLTFSVPETENIKIGNHYRYFVEPNRILIVAGPEGGNTISRKVAKGSIPKALFDIRSKKIRDFMQKSDSFEVEILGDKIIVSCYQKFRVSEVANKLFSISDYLGAKKQEIIIPKVLLQDSIYLEKMAAGAENIGFTKEFFLTSVTAGIGKTKDEMSDGFTGDINEIRKDIAQVYSVISLFSGCGMLDYPFHKDKAFRIDYAIDYDKAACESYKGNIGDVIQCASVMDIDPFIQKETNLIIGGPSCKAHSNANRKKRLNQHEDVDLIDGYIRVVQANRPDVFVIENVPEFISAKEGNAFMKVLSNLSEYEITSQIVKDCEVGGYTKRSRAIIIGSKIGRISLPNLKILPMRTVKEALSKVDASWFNYEDITRSSDETIRNMAYVPQGGNYKYIPAFKGNTKMHSDRYYRLALDGISPTLPNWRKLPLIHPTKNRVISVAEAIALSGFDKDFKVVGTLGERQQQIGNGVPFSIGNLIKKTVKKALDAYYQVPSFQPV